MRKESSFNISLSFNKLFEVEERTKRRTHFLHHTMFDDHTSFFPFSISSFLSVLYFFLPFRSLFLSSFYISFFFFHLSLTLSVSSSRGNHQVLYNQTEIAFFRDDDSHRERERERWREKKFFLSLLHKHARCGSGDVFSRRMKRQEDFQ